ncbi:MAG: hypothetical protein SNJ75_14440 [Gemmataceae bacterium]
MLLCLLTVMTTPGQCPNGGGGPASVFVSRPSGAIHSPNAQGLLYPSGDALLDVSPNWAWLFPDGGVTLYPGQPGSGYAARSDYSCIHWLVPPQQNAMLVKSRLAAMGIPEVPPEPLYWGKNPTITDSIDRLPLPRPRLPEPPQEESKEPTTPKTPKELKKPTEEKPAKEKPAKNPAE